MSFRRLACATRQLQLVGGPLRSARRHVFSQLIACHGRCDLRPLSPRTRCFSSVDAPLTCPVRGDTIYALSTAQGRAGIAIVRLSGPSCLEVYRALCPGKEAPKPRYATVRTLYEPKQDSQDGNVLDNQALVLYFPAPKTVTGEDVLEFHIHGGTATIKAVLSAIGRCSSRRAVRYAEPGEFTKRAFLHGHLDLAQVEALGDSLAAETEQQRRAAVRASGALSRRYEAWREKLLLARGELEALIDFSEDQHFDEPQSELLVNVTARIEQMLHGIRLHELGSQRSELLRNGIRIALLGSPNVGKSSLMNLIVGREASIVSSEAGTTRDVIEASLDIRGYLCSFADTAGFRRAKDASPDDTGGGSRRAAVGAVESEGIRRARVKVQEAQIVIVLASIERRSDGPRICYDEETLLLAAEADSHMILLNKRDVVDSATLAKLQGHFSQVLASTDSRLTHHDVLAISCQEAGEASPESDDPGGLGNLTDALEASFSGLTKVPADNEDLLGVTERQRQLLQRCRLHLEAFRSEAQRGGEKDEASAADADVVLAAEYLRYAADCLARLTGRGEGGDVEEVLGVVFEK